MQNFPGSLTTTGKKKILSFNITENTGALAGTHSVTWVQKTVR